MGKGFEKLSKNQVYFVGFSMGFMLGGLLMSLVIV